MEEWVCLRNHSGPAQEVRRKLQTRLPGGSEFLNPGLGFGPAPRIPGPPPVTWPAGPPGNSGREREAGIRPARRRGRVTAAPTAPAGAAGAAPHTPRPAQAQPRSPSDSACVRLVGPRVWLSVPFLRGHDAAAAAAPRPRPLCRLRRRPLSGVRISGCAIRGYGWCFGAGSGLR